MLQRLFKILGSSFLEMEREWCDNLGTECLNINSDFSELRQSFCKRIFLLGRFRSIVPVFTIFLFSDCLYTSWKQKEHLTEISAKYGILCRSSGGWQKVSRSFQTKPFWKCVHEHVFCVRKNYCRCVFISKWISVAEMVEAKHVSGKNICWSNLIA